MTEEPALTTWNRVLDALAVSAVPRSVQDILLTAAQEQLLGPADHIACINLRSSAQLAELAASDAATSALEVDRACLERRSAALAQVIDGPLLMVRVVSGGTKLLVFLRPDIGPILHWEEQRL